MKADTPSLIPAILKPANARENFPYVKGFSSGMLQMQPATMTNSTF